MEKCQLLTPVGWAEENGNGGYKLYVRAKIECAVGHIVTKTFTANELDHELLDAEPWMFPEHRL